jgi:2-furoyl-CoA dehydrogenase large subunit
MTPAPESSPARWIGARVRRREDFRLLTGTGRFVDDFTLPGLCHAAILRSPHAHARIVKLDASKALALPGVYGVVAGREVAERSTPYPVGVPHPPRYYPAAVDKVRYVGEPVALVVAVDRYVAEDALSEIGVEYEPLPAVVDTEQALGADAPLLHEELGSNVAWRRTYRQGDPERAFAEADVVVQERFRLARYSATPLETYGVVAAFDALTGVLTLWSNLQGLYAVFYVLARSLGLPEDRLRLIVAPDIGGGFGIKVNVYPYMTLCGLAAMKLNRPVKWIEDRREHLVASSCAADRVCELSLAARRDGAVTAITVKLLDNVGAYVRSPEPACVLRAYSSLTGPYRIQHVELDAATVHTNKMPTGSNRGYGLTPHYFCLERTMDRLAERCGLDPVEIRLRNFIGPGEFPYTTPTGGLYDSGDYPASLGHALELAGYEDLRALQRAARAEGRLVGIGVAVAVDPSASSIGYITLAFTPEQRARYLPKSGSMETVSAGIDGLGKITVTLCTAPQGQGHETVAAQIVADALGVSPDAVQVVNEFDTFRSAWNISSGTYSSRFGSIGISAVARAAQQLAEKLLRIAAHLLEADPRDLECRDGRIAVKGVPDRSVPLKHVAGFAHWNTGPLVGAGIEEPLPRTTATFAVSHLTPPDAQDRMSTSATFAFVAEVAAVEVERETGAVKILKYVSVHDAGTVVNPAIAEGQVLGSVAHGLGQALFEEMAYDDTGQPLAGSFMDYLCPTAMEMPAVEIGHVASPSPFTPLGTKGLGEGSAETAPAVIASAVADALAPLGVRVSELPLSPARLWSRMTSTTARHTREDKR